MLLLHNKVSCFHIWQSLSGKMSRRPCIKMIHFIIIQFKMMVLWAEHKYWDGRQIFTL